MTAYSVKEIYYTLQGEGVQAGRPAVFCRFAGCNLWSGREDDRPGATCTFCDTDFVGVDGPGGGRFASVDALAGAIAGHWPQAGSVRPFVVLTGGEPLLQADGALISALHARGFFVAVETNGTIAAPAGLDWVCVSPKGRAPLTLRCGDELKFVFPQEGLDPSAFEALDFAHFVLQPMDGPKQMRNIRLALDYCLAHPRWRLSLQTHKILSIP
ncbi:MAG: 7-carboxy-7-deazaguanine synthase [Rhodospirillales bacterium]|nr:7-carboxy-7-deazaguanine synthase [Rhodospirillales bacterium]